MTIATADVQKGEDLQPSIRKTYRALRLGLGLSALALPVILALVGLARGVELQRSMSAYYYTNMRDVLVGVLFAAGAGLFLYEGYSRAEDRMLNIGGAFAIGVALVPTDPIRGRITLHGTLAVLFFVCLAYVAVFRAKDTLVLIANERRKQLYRSIYRLLGAAMVLLPLAAFVLISVLEYDREPGKTGLVVFFVESAAIYAFGAFWLVKSAEISRTQRELEAQGNAAAKQLA